MSTNSASESPGDGELTPSSHAPTLLGRVVVILPALNEALAIGQVLAEIPREELRDQGYALSVWVVDGKSMDATREVAMGKGAGIFVQRGNGKGSGIAQALDYFIGPEARLKEESDIQRYFIMLDSDGTYPPEAIPRFVNALEKGYDVVMGSRFLGRIEEGALTLLNRIGNIFLTGFARFLYRVPVTDVCTGMWGFAEKFLRQFASTADGFDLEADIFASACEDGTRLAEVPITYRRRIGTPKLVPIRTGLLIAKRLLLRWLRRAEPLRKRVRRRLRLAGGAQ